MLPGSCSFSVVLRTFLLAIVVLPFALAIDDNSTALPSTTPTLPSNNDPRLMSAQMMAICKNGHFDLALTMGVDPQLCLEIHMQNGSGSELSKQSMLTLHQGNFNNSDEHGSGVESLRSLLQEVDNLLQSLSKKQDDDDRAEAEVDQEALNITTTNNTKSEVYGFFGYGQQANGSLNVKAHRGLGSGEYNEEFPNSMDEGDLFQNHPVLLTVVTVLCCLVTLLWIMCCVCLCLNGGVA